MAKLTEKEILEKYKDGRICTVCNIKKNINEFKFKPENSAYRNDCNDCHKLVSDIVQKRKRKNFYAVIKYHEKQINRLKIIIDNINKTDTEIAKIIKNNY
jgi:hypothetical protein